MLISQSEGTSAGQFTNGHDSLNAAAIIQKFMKDFRSDSDGQALFRADSNLSNGASASNKSVSPRDIEGHSSSNFVSTKEKE